MSYTALYRKWRPQTFEEIKGQTPIVQTLKNQIKTGRIAHAYIFNGTRGTGKTTAAKIMARAVNCENPENGSPCCRCKSCLDIESGKSLNVREIDAASNNGVENIRELREDVVYAPAEGKYKVYIIDEAHMITPQAFNALLKTLEEPPEYAIFIMATTEMNKIPVTIASRCQRYDFSRISTHDIEEQIKNLAEKEEIKIEDKAVKYIARSADGAMRDALSLLDRCVAFYLGNEIKYEGVLDILGAIDTEIYSDMLNACINKDTAKLLKLFDNAVNNGGLVTRVINDYIEYLRNILMVNIALRTTVEDELKLSDSAIMPDVSEDNRVRMVNDAKNIDENDITYYIRELSELSSSIRYSAQQKILAEVMFVKLTHTACVSDDAKERIVEVDRPSYNEKALEDIENLKSEISELRNAVKNISTEGVKVVQKPKEEKKIDYEALAKAMPEDIKNIIGLWDTIFEQFFQEVNIPECYNKTNAKPTISDDGQSIVYVVNSRMYYDFLMRVPQKDGKRNKDVLTDIIAEMTGVEVHIDIKLVEDEDIYGSTPNIKELIKIPIEIDDRKEEI